MTNTKNILTKTESLTRCLKYWCANNLGGWAMPQKMLVNDFKWVEDISEFNEDFIKSNNDESDERIFLKLMFNTLKICITFTMIYLFLLIIPEKMKTETVGFFAVNLLDKEKYVIHIKI